MQHMVPVMKGPWHTLPDVPTWHGGGVGMRQAHSHSTPSGVLGGPSITQGWCTPRWPACCPPAAHILGLCIQEALTKCTELPPRRASSSFHNVWQQWVSNIRISHGMTYENTPLRPTTGASDQQVQGGAWESAFITHSQGTMLRSGGFRAAPLPESHTIHMGTANRGSRWASESLPGLQGWPASGSPEGYLLPAAPARVEGSRPFLLHWGLQGLSWRCQGRGIKGNLCTPASPDLAWCPSASTTFGFVLNNT